MVELPPRTVKKIELLAAIGRIRRQMPRNADAMLLCEALESVVCTPTAVPAVSSVAAQAVTPQAEEPVRASDVRPRICPVCKARRAAARARAAKERQAQRPLAEQSYGDQVLR